MLTAVLLAVLLAVHGRVIAIAIDSPSPDSGPGTGAAHQFTDQWAVHVDGGLDEADRVAAAHGFTNLGQIGPLDSHYHFKKKCGSAPGKPCVSRTRRGDAHTSTLAAHPRVMWAEQQVARGRDRRRAVAKASEAVRETMQDASGADVAGGVAGVRQIRDRAAVVPTDPQYTAQWYLHQANRHDINVNAAWDQGYTGKGVVVTVVDDGMEHDHPDLKDNYDPEASTDLNGNDRDPYPNEADSINKHGTRCAGEIGAAMNDVCGVGVAFKSSIGAVRMLDGDVTDAVEAAALGFAPQHIDIYTNSWGPSDDGLTMEAPARLALAAMKNGIANGRGGKGSVYIFASGNGGSSDDCNADGYANAVFTMTISALDENNKRPYYSENCAPALACTYSSGGGRSITTTDLHKGFTSSHGGTSAAAPIAAGILALVLEANPLLTWRDVQHLVVQTSRLVDPTHASWVTNQAGLHHSNAYGFGSMDAGALVTKAKTWINVGPSTPWTSPLVHVSLPFPTRADAQEPDQQAVTAGQGRTFSITVPAAAGVARLEHVEVFVVIQAPKHGAVVVDVQCPSGTRSNLLGTRRDSSSGDMRWKMSTVACWGEQAAGVYSLTLSYASQGICTTCKLVEWQVTLHGVGDGGGSNSSHTGATPATSVTVPSPMPETIGPAPATPVTVSSSPSGTPGLPEGSGPVLRSDASSTAATSGIPAPTAGMHVSSGSSTNAAAAANDDIDHVTSIPDSNAGKAVVAMGLIIGGSLVAVAVLSTGVFCFWYVKVRAPRSRAGKYACVVGGTGTGFQSPVYDNFDGDGNSGSGGTAILDLDKSVHHTTVR